MRHPRKRPAIFIQIPNVPNLVGLDAHLQRQRPTGDVVWRFSLTLFVYAIGIDLLFKKRQDVVLLRLTQEYEKAAERDLVKIFGLAVFDPELVTHLVDLDSLPHQYLEKTRDGFGPRLTGHYDVRLRDVWIGFDIRVAKLVKIPQVSRSVSGGERKKRPARRDLYLGNVRRPPQSRLPCIGMGGVG